MVDGKKRFRSSSPATKKCGSRDDVSSVASAKKRTTNDRDGGAANGDHRPNRLERRHAESRKKLPVYKEKANICRLVSEHETVLVVAETGSGKSTQIPAFLHESGRFQSPNPKYARSICVTQPRRVAATTVAKRVAEEMGCAPGTLVGHRVRFDDRTDIRGPRTTRVVYATDGMLLREATSDPLLTRYGVVVLDEAHERSLRTDVLFGIVKRAMRARNGRFSGKKNEESDDDDTVDGRIMRRMTERAKELRLPMLRTVVMSATLNVETFQRFFPNAGMIKIPGRQYPVQTLYTSEPQEDYVDAAVNTVVQIVDEGEEGDILVFLPGQEEIESMSALLKAHLDEAAELSRTLSNHQTSDQQREEPARPVDAVRSLKGLGTNVNAVVAAGSNNESVVHGVQICQLYAALPAEAQEAVFRPKPDGCARRVVLATTIAETSVTLDSVRYVVDCGKHKTRTFSGTTGMESLRVENVSKAQAAQRAGRAGRVSSGYCFRLYAEDDLAALDDVTAPEISRVDLAHVVLQLKSCGVHDPRSFDFLTPPSAEGLRRAFERLYALRAVDDDMRLTDRGRDMSRLPLDPTFAHLLLRSPEHGCVSETLSAVAMLSAENVFYRPGWGENAASSKAAVAHRRFASHEGDLPTLLSVYETWRKEAVYVPSSAGGRKAQKRLLRENEGSRQFGKTSHGEWCARNFINGRALVRAYDVRNQLSEICSRDKTKNGLGWDVRSSCGAEMESFLRCVCAGLFLQSAVRTGAVGSVKDRRRERQASLEKGGAVGGRYRTKNGGREVSIHPTSALFGRNPAPKCVVFCELLETKRAYIRAVTQIREEWLTDVAPDFFKT